MSDHTSHSSPAPKKLWVRLLTILILVGIAFLKPKVEAWLGQNPESDGDSAAVGTADGQLGTAPPVAQQTAAPKEKTVSAPVTAPPSGTVAKDKASVSPKTTVDKTPTKATPGKLALIAGTRDEFRSTAGLMYLPGSADGHRLKHVLKHAKDNPEKPVHGVFSGTRDEILAWIDIAFEKGKKGGKGVQREQQNDRTVYTVDLGEKIGFVGGQVGKRKNHPPCRYLRLVVEGNEVITAYPSDRL